MVNNKYSYILGCLFGDAFIRKSMIWRVKKNKYADYYSFGMTSVDKEFIIFFKECLISCGCNGSMNIRTWKSNVKTWKDQYEVYVHDQEFINNLLAKKNSFNFNSDINFDFLKGLIDSEGCIRINRKSYDSDIMYVSTNKELLEGCKIFMESNGFKNVRLKCDRRKNRKDVYEVYISTYPNMKLFKDKIGFTIHRKAARLETVLKEYEVKIKDSEKYIKAIELRKNGKTIPFINRELGVPIGTLLGWIYYKRKPHILNHI